jgi:hypothetical protein
MSLTAAEMKVLEEDARVMATESRRYLADATQCLRETLDPVAPLELLRALWSTAHARRPQQKAALQAAGDWLDDRVRRDPALSPQRLELELGWLRRLVAFKPTDRSGNARDDRYPPHEPPFGSQIDALRRKRAQLLARAAPNPVAPPSPPDAARPPRPAPPAELPESFEAHFANWRDAGEAFKTARKRIKQQKQPKERLLAVLPVREELRALASDIVCCLLRTYGMTELQERAVASGGELPRFWIGAADLVHQEGKRLVTRISLQGTSLAAATSGPPALASPVVPTAQ